MNSKEYVYDYSKLISDLEESAKINVPYPHTLVDKFMHKWNISEEEVPMTEEEYNNIKSAYYGFDTVNL